jgi:diguanylate cyclase (GGDEF)-like protein/PAS domain S-box-containing protein
VERTAAWFERGRSRSGRITAEEALLRESARFRTAFEDAPIGMALVAQEGRFLRVNRSLCDITGYDENELLRLDFQQITHADDVDRDVEQARRLLAGELRRYQMEKRYRRRDGRIVWVMLSVSLVRDCGRTPYFLAQIEDIDERKQAERQLRRLADHDPLTGLLNRRRFNEELEREAARARRQGGAGALLVVDLDRFKLVNDSHGHRAGDSILRAVGRTLEDRLRSSDLAFRIGGDEFAVIAPGCGNEPDARAFATDVAEAIRSGTIAATAIRVTASIGVALIGAAAGSGDDVFAAADDAMYAAKRRGPDQIAHAA